MLRVLILSVAVAVPAIAQSPCGVPHLVGVPHSSADLDARLLSVSGVAANDVWAAGYSQTPGPNPETFSYAVHWDGRAWTQAPTPSPAVAPGIRVCELHAVKARASDDVWAAGNRYMAHPANNHIGPQLFILHWDGSTWVDVPAPITQFNYMGSTSGSTIRDIEFIGDAVVFFGYWPGDQFTPMAPMMLTLRNGNFTMDLLPQTSTARTAIYEADVLAPNDIWVVGGSLTGGGSYQPYAARYDGSTWRTVSVPQQLFTYYTLESVLAMAANDVWIAGFESPLNGGSTVPYVVHFDGTRWQRVPTTGFPYQLVRGTSGDLWSFGSHIEHWNGSSWRVAHELGREVVNGHLRAGAVVGACEVWGVGAHTRGVAAVVPLSAHIGQAGSGAATVRLPCTGAPLRASIAAATTPRLARPFTIALDDPSRESGVTPGNAVGALFFAAAPAPGHPCGIAVAGVGPGGGLGEFFLDPALTLMLTTPVAWGAHGSSAVHALSVPSTRSTLGLRLYAQGLLLDGGGRLSVTSGLDLTVGQ